MQKSQKIQKIYFLRHGVAYEPEEWRGGNDEKRPLIDKGIKAMKREAKTLRKMAFKLDRLISSPLVRARDTARIVAKELDIEIEENDLLKPGFNRERLESLLAQLGDAKRIMVVGHEPDFSATISQLIGGGSVEMSKGGLARIDVTTEGPLRGDLVWLLTPPLLGA